MISIPFGLKYAIHVYESITVMESVSDDSTLPLSLGMRWHAYRCTKWPLVKWRRRASSQIWRSRQCTASLFLLLLTPLQSPTLHPARPVPHQLPCPRSCQSSSDACRTKVWLPCGWHQIRFIWPESCSTAGTNTSRRSRRGSKRGSYRWRPQWVRRSCRSPNTSITLYHHPFPCSHWPISRHRQGRGAQRNSGGRRPHSSLLGKVQRRLQHHGQDTVA